jgi:hypothetical protein
VVLQCRGRCARTSAFDASTRPLFTSARPAATVCSCGKRHTSATSHAAAGVGHTRGNATPHLSTTRNAYAPRLSTRQRGHSLRRGAHRRLGSASHTRRRRVRATPPRHSPAAMGHAYAPVCKPMQRPSSRRSSDQHPASHHRRASHAPRGFILRKQKRAGWQMRTFSSRSFTIASAAIMAAVPSRLEPAPLPTACAGDAPACPSPFTASSIDFCGGGTTVRLGPPGAA